MDGADDDERKHNANENADVDHDSKDDVRDDSVVVGTLKSVLEKQQQQQQSSESDEVVFNVTPLNSRPLDFDITQVEPTLKNMTVWVAEKLLEAQTTKKEIPAPSPTRPRSKLKIRVKPPKPPNPKLYLEPPLVTYLRPRRAPKAVWDEMEIDDPDSNQTSMGPPKEHRILKTPYETVNEALTFLKSELGIPEIVFNEMLEIERDEEYSLARVTPNTMYSMEELVIDLELYLNTMPETASSDFMKRMIMAFQDRLGLPTHPRLYNLMWMSPIHFLKYLDSVFQEVNSDLGDVTDDDASDTDVGKKGKAGDTIMEEGSSGGTSDDKPIGTLRIGAKSEPNADDESEKRFIWWSSPFGGRPYEHLPPPYMPFHEAIEILHDFINIIENDEDYEVDEFTFMNLQSDLLLPELCSLYDLFQSRTMRGVIDFIHDYFQTSVVSWFND